MKGTYCLVAVCIYLFIYEFSYLFLYVGMFGFMVQSVIIYKVNVFAMPGMRCVVYMIEGKVVESPCCNQLSFTAYCRD